MRQRGFTLIEMAFVVAIMGLIVGGAIFAIAPITLQAKVNQTNTALDQIEAALTLFVIRNNRLPCPADGHLTSASANYGAEGVQTAAVGTAADLTANNCPFTDSHSVIPWKALALDEAYSVDGWGNRISYFPAVPSLAGTVTGWNSLIDNAVPAAATTTVNCLSRISTTTAPPQGDRSTSATASAASACDPANTLTFSASGGYGTYSIPTYPFGSYIPVWSIDTTQANLLGTELTTANAGASATNLTVSQYGLRAAYVLISHGPSGWYGWTRGGTQNSPTTVYTLKQYNSGAVATMATSGGANGFVQGLPVSATDRSNPNYFDDIVRWRSPAFIIQQCGAAACGNP